MPRENRKRGKKHRAGQTEQATAYENLKKSAHSHFNPEVEPLPSSPPNLATSDSSSPFGPLDPDVKAYFRTVDEQLREWQEERPNVESDIDPNEGVQLFDRNLVFYVFDHLPERRMFFTAALSEMNGKELQLAADPECSPVLERMLYSMDDFVRRVFTDSFAGS